MNGKVLRRFVAFGVAVAATAALSAAQLAVAQSSAPTGTTRVVASLPIDNLPGKRLVSVIVEYPPGGKSPPHRHAPSAFVYAHVLSGAIRSQVNDEPPRVYHAGEAFHEQPGSDHRVSENASDTEPAQLLAVFVVDAGDEPLTTPTK